MTRLALVCLWAVLALTSIAPSAGASEVDSRVTQADALLGDSSGLERAAQLYRAYLAEHPQDAHVRQRLARALSWSGQLDAAIDEYQQILHVPGVEIERAEVLSWAGRLDEARRAFDAILERDPDNARALRGLARVHRWAGRPQPADENYRRALDLEEDDAARAEWRELRAGFRPRANAAGHYRGDSEGYDASRFGGSADTFLDLRTRIQFGLYQLIARGSVPDPVSGLNEVRSDRGREARIGFERSLSERWTGAFGVTHKHWRNAPDRWLADSRLTYRPASGGSISILAGRRDGFDATDSYEALLAGIHAAHLGVSYWRDLGRVEAFATTEWMRRSDDNSRYSGYGSLSFRLLEAHDLRLRLDTSAATNTHNSTLYYDPDLDVSSLAAIAYGLKLPGGFRTRAEAGGGYGKIRQDGDGSQGPSLSASFLLGWQRAAWDAQLSAVHSISQRAIRYKLTRFELSMARSF